MLPAVFQINNRFQVDSLKNQVHDDTTKETKKIEPRLMGVLCFLAARNNEMVGRDLLIKEIWADYPGAGEGLNQAISILRKVLDDEEKQIIRTVPKSGYIFSAEIGTGPVEDGVVKLKQSKSSAITWKLIVVGAVLVFLSGYFLNKRLNPVPDKTIEMQRAMEASKNDSAHQAEMEKAYRKK